MLKKMFTTIVTITTAMAISVLPVSAAETTPTMTVGDAAHGYVDVPTDWVQDTRPYYYKDGTEFNQISYNNTENNQSITLILEPLTDTTLDEATSNRNLISNLESIYADGNVYHNLVMTPVLIAGRTFASVAYDLDGQYVADGTIGHAVEYWYADSRGIHVIQASSCNGSGYEDALAIANTFRFQ